MFLMSLIIIETQLTIYRNLMTYPICRCNPDNNVDSLLRKVPSVTSNDQCRSLNFVSKSIEYRLDEVLGIMFLHKHLNLLSQATCTRFLSLEGGCWHHHRVQSHFLTNKQRNENNFVAKREIKKTCLN